MFKETKIFWGIIVLVLFSILILLVVIYINKKQLEVPIIDTSYKSPRINYFEDILRTDLFFNKIYNKSSFFVATLDLKGSNLNKNNIFLHYNVEKDQNKREKWYKDFSEQEFQYNDLYLRSSYEKYYLGDYKYALDDINMYITKYPNSYKGYIAKALILETIYDFTLSNEDKKITKKNISSKIVIKDLNSLKKINKDVATILNKEIGEHHEYNGLSQDNLRIISKTQITDLDIFIEDPILNEILYNYYKALEILSKLGKKGYRKSTFKAIPVSEAKIKLSLNKDIVIKDFYNEEETFCIISIKLLLDKIVQNIIVKDIIGKDIFYFYELLYNDSFLNKQIQVSGNIKNRQELADLQKYRESLRAECLMKNLDQTFYKIGISNNGYQAIINLLSGQLDNSNINKHLGVLNAINENIYSKILTIDKQGNDVDIYDRLQESNPYFAPYYIKNLDLSKKDKKLKCKKAIFVAADKEYVQQKCNEGFIKNYKNNLKNYVVTQTKVQPIQLRLHLEWHPEERTVEDQMAYLFEKHFYDGK